MHGRNFLPDYDPVTVCMEIENLVAENKKYLRNSARPYLNAILEFVQKNRIDFDGISGLLSETIKQKLRVEAENLHYLPRIARLPV